MKHLFFILYLFKEIISKLLFVHVHIRHGARGSSKGGFLGSGKDYLNINWETNSELTEIGIRQEYILGFNTRIKYKNFLSYYYNPKEILIYSTFINRAIQSGYSFINGLYFPKNIFLTNEQIKNSFPSNLLNKNIEKEIIKLGNLTIPNGINIIPIHIFNMKDHDFLLFAEISCKPVIKKRKEILKSNYIKNTVNNFQNKYKKKLDTFFNKTNINFLWDFDHIQDFCDNFISDKIQQIDLSYFNQITKISFNELEKDCNEIFRINLEDYQLGNKDIFFMSQTPVIKKLINYMEKRIEIEEGNLENNNLDYNSPKFIVYSAHDSSMSGVMLWMKELFDCKTIVPSFSSSLNFELYKKDNNLKGNYDDYYIKYIINDEEILIISFLLFKEKSKKYFWSDKEISHFCQFDIINKDIKEKEIKQYLLILCGLLALFTCMLFYFIRLFFYYKNKSKNKKNREDKELEDIFINK